jgi:hypothetical protein
VEGGGEGGCADPCAAVSRAGLRCRLARSDGHGSAAAPPAPRPLARRAPAGLQVLLQLHPAIAQLHLHNLPHLSPEALEQVMRSTRGSWCWHGCRSAAGLCDWAALCVGRMA